MITEFNPFIHLSPGILLYFHYGLTFIFLGIAIVAKNMKGSNLKIAVPLQSLAVFGFTHGTLEWLELYRVFFETAMSSQQILVLKTVGLFFGITSFFVYYFQWYAQKCFGGRFVYGCVFRYFFLVVFKILLRTCLYDIRHGWAHG